MEPDFSNKPIITLKYLEQCIDGPNGTFLTQNGNYIQTIFPRENGYFMMDKLQGLVKVEIIF